jgi:hypothetical protein
MRRTISPIRLGLKTSWPKAKILARDPARASGGSVDLTRRFAKAAVVSDDGLLQSSASSGATIIYNARGPSYHASSGGNGGGPNGRANSDATAHPSEC